MEGQSLMEASPKQQRFFAASVAEMAKQQNISPADALVMFGRMAALLAENEAVQRGITLADAKQHASALFAEGLATDPSTLMAQYHKPTKSHH
jgi:hypothetical protein